MVNIWKVAPGRNAEVWDQCTEAACCSINWLNQSNLRDFSERAELLVALQESGEGSTASCNAIMRFVHEIRRNDIIVANDGARACVGIGRVSSGYLHPEHKQNPHRSSTHHRHVRKVVWSVMERVQFKTPVFHQFAVYQLTEEKWNQICAAYSDKRPEEIAKLRGNRQDSTITRPDAYDASDGASYEIPLADHRERIHQSIYRRRGQSRFRNALLRCHHCTCQVTGCRIVDLLEAAHIDPWQGDGSQYPQNGLLLRADIHTLFDLHLLAIHPKSHRIELHPDVREEYRGQVGRVLRTPTGLVPSEAALQRRYEQFRNNLLQE